jgi:hypothetical protein
MQISYQRCAVHRASPRGAALPPAKSRRDRARHAAARRVRTIGSAEVAVTIGVEWTKCFTDVT